MHLRQNRELKNEHNNEKAHHAQAYGILQFEEGRFGSLGQVSAGTFFPHALFTFDPVVKMFINRMTGRLHPFPVELDDRVCQRPHDLRKNFTIFSVYAVSFQTVSLYAEAVLFLCFGAGTGRLRIRGGPVCIRMGLYFHINRL